MNWVIFSVTLVKAVVLLLLKWLRAMILFIIPNEYKFMNVENKVVLITGAASGVGAALAIKFSQRKCRLVLWDMNEDGLNKVAIECKKHISETAIVTYKVDITNRERVMEVAEHIKKSIGCVDILVNNAGIVSGKSVMDVDEATVKKVLDVNVVSNFWTVQAFLPDMMRRKSGDIVCMASLAGYQGAYKLAAYNASKFGAVGFQESLFQELSHAGQAENINVLTVCPFYINTGMFDGVEAKNPLMQILDLEYAATKIEEAILLRSKMLIMPRIAYFCLFLKSFLPVDATMELIDFIGLNESMTNFKGRQKSE